VLPQFLEKSECSIVDMNTFIRQKAEQTDRQTDKQTNKQKQTSDIHSCDEDSFTCSN